MKNFVILLVVGGLLYLAYVKWQEWNTPPPVAEAAVPGPIKHLMPEGTFAILDYVSVRTKTGVVGFEPGQPVRFVSADLKTGTLQVTDGTYQVAVKPEQLTNDLDVAAIARRKDQDSQKKLQSYIAAAKDEDARIHLQANIEAAKNLDRYSSGAVIGTSSTLNHGGQSSTYYGSLQSRYPYGSPYYYLNR